MASPATKYDSPLQARLDRLPLSKVHWLIWSLTTFGFVLDSMDLYLISYAMPLIAKDWQISSENLGIIASSAMWGMMAGAYIWGYLSDKIGRRTSLQWTIGIFSVVTGICGLAWNATSLFIGRFVVGIGLGGLVPVDLSVQAEFFPPKYRGRMMAASLALWPLGGLLGAMIAWTFAPIYGWRALFIIGATPAILAFVLRFAIPESVRFCIAKGRDAEAAKTIEWMERNSNVPPPTQEELARVTTRTGAPEVHASSLKELFVKKYIARTLLTSALWFCHCLPYYGILLWLPTLLVKYYGIPQPDAIKIMMALTVIGVIGRFFAMMLLDTWGRKPLIISFSVLAGVAMLGYNVAQDTTQILIVAGIATFFYEGTWCGISPYTTELFPTKIRTTGVGFASGIGRVAAAIAPMMIGFLVDVSLSAVFYTLASLLFIEAAIAGIFAFETKSKSLEEISPQEV